MHLFLPATDSTPALDAELARAFPEVPRTDVAPGLLALTPSLPHIPHLAFCRQFLPDAQPVSAASIRGFSDLLHDALTSSLPDDAPWRIHVEPHFGGPDAGRHRCSLILEGLVDRLKRQRRQRLRQRVEGTRAFAPTEALVQLLLTEPGQGFLSIAPAPFPHKQRHLLSPFPKGDIPVASDKAAPCRAFAKLVEAELRLDRPIAPGETCVDLGASPGSWSYVALRRGARVIAVDRSPLRDDLMRHPRLSFHRGDAFTFTPQAPLDWLLCDVIAAPDRSIDLVLDWCRRRLCHRFVVTLKFKGAEDYPVVDRLKSELPPLAGDFLLTRLCANKNEVCVAGVTIPR